MMFHITHNPCFKTCSTETTSPSKRPKQPSKSGALYWEWEGDRKAWTAFADDHNQEINDAYENEEKSVKMAVGGTEIEVKIDRMVQRNCKTGWERRMRVCVEEAGNCTYLILILNRGCNIGSTFTIPLHIFNEDF